MMKNLYKSLIVGVIVCGVCLSVAGNLFAQSAPLKIGFIDLQRVINASEEGRKAQEEIQKKADEYKLQADQIQAQIEALAEDLKKQAEVLTSAAKAEKQDEIAKLELKYNRFVSDSRDELGKAEQLALQQLLEDIGKLVVEYGQQNGYTVILEAGNILYGAESIEITEDIIALYNAGKQQ
jgi:outer membrane protein